MCPLAYRYIRTRTHGYEAHRNYAGRLFIKLITPYSLCTPPPGPAGSSLFPLPRALLSSPREELRSAVFILAARCSAAAAAAAVYLAARTRPFLPTCAVTARVRMRVGAAACRYCIQAPRSADRNANRHVVGADFLRCAYRS